MYQLVEENAAEGKCITLNHTNMLNGFEEVTEPLTEKEEKVFLPPILRGLRTKIGKSRAVTNKSITRGLKENCGLTISEARVRKIINYIRCKDLVPCLIATSEGYYIAETEQELLDYEESLAGRESAIREVRESIQRQRMRKYWNKQSQLEIEL